MFLFKNNPVLIFIPVLIFFSCTKDKAELKKEGPPSASYCDSMKTAGKVSYKCYIDSLVTVRCRKCHKPGGDGNGDFTGFNGIKAKTGLIPGKIQANPPNGDRMPQDGPPYLPDSVIAKMLSWINDGALNN